MNQQHARFAAPVPMTRRKNSNFGGAAIKFLAPIPFARSFLAPPAAAAEWRRAVDRLTNLNTVLSPSTKAASAAAGAIKNALAGLGSRTRPEGPAGADEDAVADGQGQRPRASSSDNSSSSSSSSSSGAAGADGGNEFVSSREGWREDKNATPSRNAGTDGATATAVAEAEPLARPATDAFAAAMGAGKGEGAQRGGRGEGEAGDCEKKETDRKRDDLGRSVRDTALTMRGLAKLYPLSQSFR